MIDYRKHAEECRDLATREKSKMEDGLHFLEMAQTWEKLADLHKLTQRLKCSGALLTKPATRAERSARLAQEAEVVSSRLAFAEQRRTLGLRSDR